MLYLQATYNLSLGYQEFRTIRLYLYALRQMILCKYFWLSREIFPLCIYQLASHIDFHNDIQGIRNYNSLNFVMVLLFSKDLLGEVFQLYLLCFQESLLSK